ncbi:hypothetical protein [Pectinatus haikarae]|uniref:Uncharacterized protein n=1 Tax=Pectinatus haikarae TaxID=349096 RepID=A0ABT9Y6Z7_9FIRM|nr:hypothetical protein [Pectinatus haikarae]MDQ0203471.1 hypothetical protein [Pectinatus haikarae]
MIYKNFSQKDFDEAEKAYNSCSQKIRPKVPAVPAKNALSRGQYTALFIAAVISVYSIFSWDIPGFFFGMSFCTWMLQYFICRLIPAHSQAVVSLLRSLSLTLFFGSIILLLL